MEYMRPIQRPPVRRIRQQQRSGHRVHTYRNPQVTQSVWEAEAMPLLGEMFKIDLQVCHSEYSTVLSHHNGIQCAQCHSVPSHPC